MVLAVDVVVGVCVGVLFERRLVVVLVFGTLILGSCELLESVEFRGELGVSLPVPFL